MLGDMQALEKDGWGKYGDATNNMQRLIDTRNSVQNLTKMMNQEQLEELLDYIRKMK